MGSNRDSEIHAEYLAEEQNMIIVIPNYRLTGFGFWVVDEKDAMDGNRANWAILDQQRALEWTKRYISSFGGNPNMITGKRV